MVLRGIGAFHLVASWPSTFSTLPSAGEAGTDGTRGKLGDGAEVNSAHEDGSDPDGMPFGGAPNPVESNASITQASIDDLDTARSIGARMMTGGLITALFVMLSLFSLFSIAYYGAIFVIPSFAGVVAGILVFRFGMRRWRQFTVKQGPRPR